MTNTITLTLSNDHLDILHFVRKCNDEGDPITEDDLSSMSESFGLAFRDLCEAGYILDQEIADEVWYYPSEQGMSAIAIHVGQMALPGFDGTLAKHENGRVFAVRKMYGIEVFTLRLPEVCKICGEKAAYHKDSAGYEGLYHCASCKSWYDLVEGWTMNGGEQ